MKPPDSDDLPPHVANVLDALDCIGDMLRPTLRPEFVAKVEAAKAARATPDTEDNHDRRRTR